MKKKSICRLTIASIMSSILLCNMSIPHDSSHELTDLALLNVEALASDEAEPIKVKSCYMYTSTTLLPDEPATYVTKCDGCCTTKATMCMYTATCAGSQIIY